MNLKESIESVLSEDGGQTSHELAVTLGRSESTVRNALSDMYFVDQTIVCDLNGQHHLREARSWNGIVTIGHKNKRDHRMSPGT